MKEQAFILVNEALSLEARKQPRILEDSQHAEKRFIVTVGGRIVEKPRKYRKRGKGESDTEKRPRKPRQPGRRRVYRLAGDSKRREFEEEMTRRLKEKYQRCRDLKNRVELGDKDAIDEWMAAAKELTDDFRSFREFYTWEKYVKFLGFGQFLEGEDKLRSHEGLAALASRLQKSKTPSREESCLGIGISLTFLPFKQTSPQKMRMGILAISTSLGTSIAAYHLRIGWSFS